MAFIPYEPGATMLDSETAARLLPAERAAVEAYMRLHIARLSPLDYALVTDETAMDLPHSRLISDHLTALVENRLYKAGICTHAGLPDLDVVWRHPEDECFISPGSLLLHNIAITAPPRHGKSFMVSRNLPAWYLARYPRRKVAIASYESDFASSWGEAAQEALLILASELGLTLDRRNTAKDDWKLAAPFRGHLATAGVGGPLTGKGFNLLIGDDLIKNSQEAQSQTERENRWNWLVTTFFTRGEPVIENRLMVSMAKKVVMHTRWNEDDPIGRLREKMSDEWFFLDLPAIAVEDDPMGRAPGEALCTVLHPLSELEGIRKGDPFWFEAMYQGNPTPEGMGLFSRAKVRYWRPSHGNVDYNEMVPLRDSLFLMQPDGGYLTVATKDLMSFVTVDLAATTKTSADWTVFSQWGLTPPIGPYERPALVLLRIMRERMESANHMRRLREWVSEGFPNVRIQYVAIEEVTYGLTLIQNYRRARGMPPARPLKADKDKVTRAIPAGAMMEDGRIYVPRFAPWTEAWIQEHIIFPNGAHDDRVDTTAYAGIAVQQWHDFGWIKQDDHTQLPSGVSAGRTVEERYQRHLLSKLRGPQSARAARNRL